MNKQSPSIVQYAIYNLLLSVLIYLALSLPVYAETGKNNETPDKKETINSDGLTGKKARQALDVLIKRQQYPQAYILASRIVEENEGDSTFDMQYGMAAIETAHYNEALYAFERLVLLDGSQPRYRLELARAHFFLRNLEQSEIEFNRVLRQNPPKTVQDNVDKFLEKITQLKRTFKPKFNAIADIGSGFDSNINSATDSRLLPQDELVFDFDIPLSERSRETESLYLSALANASYSSPLTKNSAWDIRGDVNTRINDETSHYNVTGLKGEGGYSFYAFDVKWRAAGQYQYLFLDGEGFLDTFSGLVQGFVNLPRGYSLATGLNGGFVRFIDSDNKDLTQIQLNASIAPSPQKYNWVVAALVGGNSAEYSENDHNGKSYFGLSAQMSSNYGAKILYYVLASGVFTEHDEIDRALYTKLRDDTIITLGGGLRYTINRRFSVRNDTSWINSDSSLEAFTYSRFKTEFGLTYQF